jgi:hypothetical protein
MKNDKPKKQPEKPKTGIPVNVTDEKLLQIILAKTVNKYINEHN